MEAITAVTEYLRAHWKVCGLTRGEKESDVAYYETRPDPYGPAFANRLRSNLAKELRE